VLGVGYPECAQLEPNRPVLERLYSFEFVCIFRVIK
jgi:hypothetical protein